MSKIVKKEIRYVTIENENKIARKNKTKNCEKVLKFG